jgi:PBSX family phage terminase large subunit
MRVSLQKPSVSFAKIQAAELILAADRSRRRIKAPYQPHPWQATPFVDTSSVVLFTGSAGGGKSRLAAEKIHRFLLTYPGSTALMLRKAREFASKSIVPFMAYTVIGKDPRVRMKKSDSLFQYKNGSILYWGGMKDEAQREALRSIGQDGSLDIAWIEEATAFVLDDYEELLARMRGKAAPYTQILLTTNPDKPTHWIYQRLIKGGEASVYYSSALDNPSNPPHYIDTLNKLTGVRRLRLVEGKWVQAEGAVYADYDPLIHLIDPFPIPSDWRRIRAIDFGYTNPFVCQWWAIDPDGRMYLYREIYRTQRLVEDHARDILALETGERIEATVADWDAEDRATLERHGVYTQQAIKDVSPGIQAVQQRLRIAGDGKARLFILRGSLVDEDSLLVEAKKPMSIADEFEGYAWEKAKEGKAEKENPLKVDDHSMDTMRYAAMYLENPVIVLSFENPFF